MEIPIVIEFDAEADGVGYKARCRHPVAAEATGNTKYEATRALEAALAGRVPGPFEFVPLDATSDPPWVAAAGWLPDDDLTAQYLEAVAAHRRDQDARDRDAP